jgi:hypothetical protein
MRHYAFLAFLALFTLLLAASAKADIYAANSTGDEKNTFYTNESVYIAGNISTTSTVDIYAVTDNETWQNLTAIGPGSVNSVAIAPNASGWFYPAGLVWSAPKVGKYDIVVDVNRNGKYDIGTDFLDSGSATGFEILQSPEPTLTIREGPNNPDDHNWDYILDAEDDPMLQINVTAGSYETIKIISVGLNARGTSGSEETGVTVVKVIQDADASGTYEVGQEALIAYNNYKKDDGITVLQFTQPLELAPNANGTWLFVYTLSTKVAPDDEFYFQLASIDAVGATTGKLAKITGLPMDSATALVTNAPPLTTAATTEETTTVATTTAQATTTETTTTTPGEEKSFLRTYWWLIAIIIAVIVVPLLIALFMRSRVHKSKQEYVYKEMQQPEGQPSGENQGHPEGFS